MQEHSRREKIRQSQERIASVQKRQSEIDRHNASFTDEGVKKELSGSLSEEVYDHLRQKGFPPFAARTGALSIPDYHSIPADQWKGIDAYKKEAEASAENAAKTPEDTRRFHDSIIHEEQAKIDSLDFIHQPSLRSPGVKHGPQVETRTA